jgi:hypothetical protein
MHSIKPDGRDRAPAGARKFGSSRANSTTSGAVTPGSSREGSPQPTATLNAGPVVTLDVDGFRHRRVRC